MSNQYNRKQQHVIVLQQQPKSILYNNPPMNPQHIIPHSSKPHRHVQQVPKNLLKALKILKKLINLHSTNIKSQQKHSISQIIIQIIQKLLYIFKNITNNKQKQQCQFIQQQLTKIRQIALQFVDKIIHIIENVKQYYKQIQRQGENCQIDVIEEFYGICSQFMNDSYQYSNKLCLLLSKYNAQSLSQYKSHPNVPKIDPTNTNKFTSSNTDYQILKKLLQKVSSTRKIYQQQKKNWQNQKYILQQIIKQQKQQIKNLINIKNQLFQDLYEIQQAIQARNYGIIKNIVHREKYQNKQQSRKTDKQFRNNQQSKITQLQPVVNSQNQHENTIKYLQQIKQLSHNNQLLQNENKQLKIKLDKYIKQIHRAAWIISIQNRQINLNQDKNKLYLKTFFNPNFNGKGQDSAKNNQINSHDFHAQRQHRQKKSPISRRQYEKSPSQHFANIKLGQNNRSDNNFTMHN